MENFAPSCWSVKFDYRRCKIGEISRDLEKAESKPGIGACLPTDGKTKEQQLIHFDLVSASRFYHRQTSKLGQLRATFQNMADVNAEAFKNWMSGLSSLGTFFALVIGGYWTYKHFIDFREAAPKIEFTVDVSFIRKQAGLWIVEVIAFLENKGRVAHRMEKFTFDLRYTLPDDPVQNKDGFLVYVPHEECTGSWIPETWGSTFIEPGVRTRYSSVASLPGKRRLPSFTENSFIRTKIFTPQTRLSQYQKGSRMTPLKAGAVRKKVSLLNGV